ncbi:D-alanyl-D-alanine carboxypeptidase (penicillin-binding protein 5/6) [Seinonella peptonophila]|uniref:serine-type D-Ala-D-Ala carboxypeptidase n=1 Tax=Seinonella peptonophila TaxID=112248 RepID=A0A1M4TKF4_9BACL|nr:D-alanyl-D-alanine carboxypeptidase family protein [Seinonella peptonophila]SHE44767.1 D-alanyl-D-alanine carboxypeptidase (penicillin-binding protein 5/6) [Seinonella peptonophila]
MIIRLITMTILVILQLVMLPITNFAQGVSGQLAASARSAILIDANSGKILYEKNSHEKLAPASMTKIMTLLLIMESIEKKQLKYTDLVQVSEKAASMGGTQIFLEPGERMNVRDLVKGIAIASANDATVAMAERIAGSEQRFIALMNQRARQLGCQDTHFVNTNGLPENGHLSSSYDMALIARELLTHPAITQYTGIYEDHLRKGSKKPFWLVNTNKLIKFYPNADGLKTGFTQEAKYCLTATAKRGQFRPIAVVMGEPDIKTRNQEVAGMLDHAFATYDSVLLFRKGQKIGIKELQKAQVRKLTLYADRDISILVRKGHSPKEFKYSIKWLKEQIPIRKNELVGKLVVYHQGKQVDQVDLRSHINIEEAGLWDLLKRACNDLFLQKKD